MVSMWGWAVLEWLKKLLGTDSGKIKSFEEATANLKGAEYRNVGIASIDLDKIVGSVDRAHELDSKFRYRDRRSTGRYRNISKLIEEGHPMEPIKVVRVKGSRTTSEFYVVDGHHRVAYAKAHGFHDLNAQVTDLIPPFDAAEDTVKNEP